jgi:CheY-like chemotaxis protein
MDVLIADDDPLSRASLESLIKGWGYGVVAAADGTAAWDALRGAGAPRLVVLDWVMPGIDGPDLCRRLKQLPRPPYVILLTARGDTADLVAGLESGADDYIAKPFNLDELRARLRVGARMVALQSSLADRVAELEAALAQVKRLQGLLPICSYCKRIRVDQNYWQQVEDYIRGHSDAQFTHGICPDCLTYTVQPELDEEIRRLRAEREDS